MQREAEWEQIEVYTHIYIKESVVILIMIIILLIF